MYQVISDTAIPAIPANAIPAILHQAFHQY
jgi:hypothetical protein